MSGQDKFIGEAITPVMTEGVDPGRMAAGEPALPGAFRWRGGSFTIAGVTRRWKEHGPCHHGSGETYLRKHWFEVVTRDGRTMKIYFERQPGSGRRAGAGADRPFSISGGYPLPLAFAGHDDCEVGRLRLDCGMDNGLAFWVSCDQLLRGAALNAVEIAERL